MAVRDDGLQQRDVAHLVQKVIGARGEAVVAHEVGRIVGQNHDQRLAVRGVQLARLTDDLELIQSGLDSLSFAIIVARLENALGLDPFTASEDALFPITFGELVGLYESAAKQPQ